MQLRPKPLGRPGPQRFALFRFSEERLLQTVCTFPLAATAPRDGGPRTSRYAPHVQLCTDPLHIRPPPAVGSVHNCASRPPAPARRGRLCAPPPRAANSRMRLRYGGCRSLPPTSRWSRQPPYHRRIREFAALPPGAPLLPAGADARYSTKHGVRPSSKRNCLPSQPIDSARLANLHPLNVHDARRV